MVETLLINFTILVIRRLDCGIVNDVKLMLGVEKELDRIKNNLSRIQAVLRDAERKQSTSESLKDWLQKLQDVVYDIDDLLDEINTEVAIHNKTKGHLCRQVSEFFSRSNFVLRRLRWAQQIKAVCNKLDRVAKEKDDFGFSFDPIVDSFESSSTETCSNLNESVILGRDEDTDSIIDLISSRGDCEGISVLPVVGLGGIGKTTLAQLIYNDKRVDAYFGAPNKYKLWVYVSQRFNMHRILRQIISLVTGENLVELTNEQITLEQLSVKFSAALKDKKYFLVLDDVWIQDSNDWGRLKEFLDVGAKGSMVIVTTRDLNVASVVNNVEEYKLSELRYEMSLQILTQLAFKDGEEIGDTLECLAEEIAKKSRGIPFLVTYLGKQLHGETDEGVWRDVIKQLEEGHQDIVKILASSYEQLPSYLKQCFRFCSIFGKGGNIPAVGALFLWMALGFLPFDNRKVAESQEVIGWKCINELSKSLLQTIKHEQLPINELSELLMHDFVYDLAKSKAGDELAIIDRTSTSKDVSKNTRYIRLDEDYLSGNQSPHRLLKSAKKARLLMLKTSEHPLSKSFLQKVMSNLKCLRALDLENSQFEELPGTIGEMTHLRFLDLSNNLRIKLLPNSICNLLNLQLLTLDGCINLKELPAEIGRLENLRYLTVTTQQKVLPKGIGCLTALRVMTLMDCPRLAFLPMSTKQLENLDMLMIANCKELNLAHESWSLEGMDKLKTVFLFGLPKLQTLPFGAKGLPLTSLHNLVIQRCEGLTDKTDWIQYLTSLKTLAIRECPNLVILPETRSKLKRQVKNVRIH